MPIGYILELIKQWIITHGIFLGLLVIVGFLIPRVGRRIIDGASRTVEDGTEAAKGRKAITGAMVYIAEAVAYTALVIAAMRNLGINLAAAAIPATVVSAAVGFGSQKIIGDLLGGFFIITEKQYGVGDWVKFYGSAATVEGDVVDMTLRATTIRTINGEEITVPNGEARMCVNASARWARAVIAIPVPITAGSSVAEINARTLAAAEDALLDPELKQHVRSDITFQAATAVTPPTAMGLPWTATMRLLIDVAPGKQWLVERAVRAAVLDEWWEDYGKRASSSPLATEAVTQKMSELLDTQEFRPISAAALVGTGSDVASAAESEALANAAENVDVPRTQVMQEIVEREDDDVPKPHRGQGIWTLGGRVRPSTTVLFLALFGLLLLGSMTLSGGERSDAGWLAPKSPVTAPPEPSLPAPVQPVVPTQQPAPVTSESAPTLTSEVTPTLSTSLPSSARGVRATETDDPVEETTATSAEAPTTEPSVVERATETPTM
ncbi:mechanosensitive ion channel family protein [Corynebacterium epidermidicanis]|uniref:Small-conductance mechanosensitive channel n=1 Tax=Corynebacterium epidermidicanis TaxID=1050174 RepID=A0A0G3GZK9_9CORY|nr:mechanosensitive ion channel family protein [Corynebacterium epidermidicanis]AKK04247.1 small-conductance mechanosensitive channel [Corynebacterium epidermidicanis]